MASSAAQQLSEWLELTHPGLYAQLYGLAQRQTGAAILRRARLSGFGDDGFTLDTGLISQGVTDVLQQTAVQPLDLSSVAGNALVDVGSIASQYTPPTAEPIQPIGITPPSNVGTTSFAPPPSSSGGGTLDVQTDNSGGFLQSIGSGIASAAGSVAHFLTSQQGLTALTNLGTAYFKLQQNQVNAQLQQQVLQAQIQRAQSSASPAPITYVQGPGGQLIPVYTTTNAGGYQTGAIPPGLLNAINSGQSQPITLPDGSTGYTIPSNMVGSLGGSISLTQMLPWIALIGAGLLLLASANKS